MSIQRCAIGCTKLALLIVTISICWPALSYPQDKQHTSAPGATPTRPPTSTARVIRLSLEGNAIRAGNLPSILATYDKAGDATSVGAVSLSADLSDVTLDMSALPERLDPWSPKLGIQLQGNSQVALASLRVRRARKVYLDRTGMAWPDDVSVLSAKGPTIGLTLLSPKNSVISLSSVIATVRDQRGKNLLTQALQQEILRVEDVPRELLTITLRDRRNDQSWVVDIFPKFRAAGKDVVLYSILDVPVGESLSADPTYK